MDGWDEGKKSNKKSLEVGFVNCKWLIGAIGSESKKFLLSLRVCSQSICTQNIFSISKVKKFKIKLLIIKTLSNEVSIFKLSTNKKNSKLKNKFRKF